ncbi:ATP-binding protein [Falsirhodobacter sp. 20TX0035]|uniref:ATP-binding protein n=1 Tax=Falsirhodobacter sp. 20TX0035 TaxID=3022019 RepID=UPI00233078B6|nr:ATP-binding protein [Falsirhodobacter sp. 20TX0035]MDB6453703.1 sensor histidine kinase N-terminal domain-containing protein [Falsirhodobacter sp. 20TX0035]
MIPIRLRMFLILLAATGAVWVSGFVWIHQSTAAKMDRVLDARLAEAARMVSTLVTDERVSMEGAASLPMAVDHAYSRQLSCQIWRLDGTPVAGSSAAPKDRLAATEGFSMNTVDGVEWRVYSMVNAERGVRVMVGDSMTMRKRLIGDVTRGLILPALAVLPVLAGLIWIGLGRGLRPLRRMAGDLAARDAEDLRPLDRRLPAELSPIQSAMNDLFRRVEETRDRERSFTAFAAHELKTPLAGLKTQAQIALRGDDDQRRRALRQIEASVARTDRLVRQLLEMAAVDAREAGQNRAPLEDIVADCVQATEVLARERGVGVTVLVERDGAAHDRLLLGAALRNLLENAIQASPPGAAVSIRGSGTRIEVADAGAGIREQDRPRLTERFFRGRGAAAGGSGLGLAIVQTAMQRMNGTLEFRSGPGAGVVASLTIAP